MSVDPNAIAEKLKAGIASADKLKANGSASANVARPVSSPQQVVSHDALFATGRYRDQKGRLIYGVRLEHTVGHNKEYTITVTGRPLAHSPQKDLGKNAGAMEYFVEVSYGKINGTLKTEAKPVNGALSTSNRHAAITVARDIERSKTVKGYSVVTRQEDSSAFDDLADESVDYMDDVADDLIVDPSDPPKKTGRVTLEDARRCFCMEMVEEMAVTSWVEPSPADASVPPMLFDPGYGLLRFEASPSDSLEPAPRWLVAVLDSCESDYRHARATPIGEMMAGEKYGERRRFHPGFVEDGVIEALDPKAGMAFTATGQKRNVENALDFVLVIEQWGMDLVALDALRWNGQDLTESSWKDRRTIIEQDFDKIFDKEARRTVTLVTRINDGLRENYLADGGAFRFELFRKDAAPTEVSYRLPQL